MLPIPVITRPILALALILVAGCKGRPGPEQSGPEPSAVAPAPPAAGRLHRHTLSAAALGERIGGSVEGARLLLQDGEGATAVLTIPAVAGIMVTLKALPSPKGTWPVLIVTDGARQHRLRTAASAERLPVPLNRLAQTSMNDMDQDSWPTLELPVPTEPAARSVTFVVEGAPAEEGAGAVLLERVTWQSRATEARYVKPARTRDGRLLLVGVDGLSWQTLNVALAGRRMPTFERLMGAGARGPLRSELPTISPALWNTIITSRSRESHGVIDFTVPSAAGPVPVSANDRRTATFWEMLSVAGVRSTTVNWWTTWPAASMLDGNIIVSDAFIRNRSVERGVFPASIQSRLPAARTSVGAYESLFTLWEHSAFGRSSSDARHTEAWRLDSNLSDLKYFMQEDVEVAEAARFLASSDMPVVSVYFRGFDPAAHFFGEYGDAVRFSGKVAGRNLPPDMNVLPSYLAMLDSLIAGLIRAYRFDMTRDHIAVLSDHGSARPALGRVTSYRLNYLLQQLGWLQWRYGRDASWDPEATAVYSGNSTLGDGKFDAIVEDNLRTPKYDRFNLPEAEEPRYQRIVSVLRELRTVRGVPLFTRVTRATGKPDRASAPIARVVFNTAITAADVLVHDGRQIPLAPFVYYNKTISDHDENGFIVISGPQVVPGYFSDLRIADVVPTLLPLLGLPVADDFEGRVADEVFRAHVSRGYPLVKSYDHWVRRAEVKTRAARQGIP